MRLTLLKDRYEITEREADSDDSWDRGDTQTTWSFNEVLLGDDVGYGRGETFETKDDYNVGDTICLVIAVWSTGDSFGHDRDACSEVFGAFKTIEEAEEFEKKLRGKEDIMVEDSDYPLYRPWTGYFESLSYIEISSFVVGYKRKRH